MRVRRHNAVPAYAINGGLPTAEALIAARDLDLSMMGADLAVTH